MSKRAVDEAWLAARAAIQIDDAAALAAMATVIPELLGLRGKFDNSDSANECSLLHFAAFNDSVGCVQFLAEKGLDVHEPWMSGNGRLKGQTPLSMAIMCLDEEPRRAMVGALMARGETVGSEEAGWQVAMRVACRRGYWPIMRDIHAHLGEAGVDLWPALRDDSDSSLWHFAAGCGSQKMLAMLWEWRGMKMWAEHANAAGRTPIETAKSRGNDAFALELAGRLAAEREALALSEQINETSAKLKRAKRL